MTLTEFLLARIADDEAVARAAAQREGAEAWRWGEGEDWTTVDFAQPHDDVIWATLLSVNEFPSENVEGWMLPVTLTTGSDVEVHPFAAEHIARHDPARVLAECEAKRRIVELHMGGAPRRDLVRGRDDRRAPSTATPGGRAPRCVSSPCPTPTTRITARSGKRVVRPQLVDAQAPLDQSPARLLLRPVRAEARVT